MTCVEKIAMPACGLARLWLLPNCPSVPQGNFLTPKGGTLGCLSTRTLDNLNLAIVMADTHMAEDFLPDLFAGAHRFDDLDPGPIEFGIILGAYEHAANHNRGSIGRHLEKR